MRWSVLAAVVLLSGCLWSPTDPADRDLRDDPCLGRSSLANGVHAGVWENATRPGSAFGTPRMDEGIPVGPRVATFLGTAANVTSVLWRVDGGPVEGIHGESWASGGLASPEYLELTFWSGPELDGDLDPARSTENATAVVEQFLDAIRGPQPNNPELAAAFAPWAQVVPRPSDVSDGDVEPYHGPPPSPMPLPGGTWAVSSHLAAHATADTFLEDADTTAFVDGAWRWALDVPSAAANTTYEPGASWRVAVDARDRVSVFHASNVTLDEAAFRARLLTVLPRYGIHDANLDDWNLRVDDGLAFFCTPEPMDLLP